MKGGRRPHYKAPAAPNQNCRWGRAYARNPNSQMTDRIFMFGIGAGNSDRHDRTWSVVCGPAGLGARLCRRPAAAGRQSRRVAPTSKAPRSSRLAAAGPEDTAALPGVPRRSRPSRWAPMRSSNLWVTLRSRYRLTGCARPSGYLPQSFSLRSNVAAVQSLAAPSQAW